jgi:flavin reductase (DIM6/NTAB) family NADH-FMN oxidoreductase RutF
MIVYPILSQVVWFIVAWIVVDRIEKKEMRFRNGSLTIFALTVMIIWGYYARARKKQYTGEGIKANKTFSINLPGKNLVIETDYIGIVSGRTEDKSQIFDVFYGDETTAPMIKQCPLNYELKLVDTVEVPGSNLFIGEIINAYLDQEKVTGHQPDLPAMEPFMLVETPANHYYPLGSQLAEAFKVGKALSMKK